MNNRYRVEEYEGQYGVFSKFSNQPMALYDTIEQARVNCGKLSNSESPRAILSGQR